MILFFFLMFIHVWERETEHELGGEERGRYGIQSMLQALSCQHRAWRGPWTPELWDHDLSRSQMLHLLNHLGTPIMILLNVAGILLRMTTFCKIYCIKSTDPSFTWFFFFQIWSTLFKKAVQAYFVNTFDKIFILISTSC